MLVLPNQKTSKYLIDNPGPCVLSVFISQTPCSQMSHEHGAATFKLERGSEVYRISSVQWKRKTSLMVVSCHRAPHASRRPPQDYPLKLSIPVLISRHLCAHGVSSASWLAHQLLGWLHPHRPASLVVVQPQN